MKIRIMSDLHVEFPDKNGQCYQIEPMPEDKETVLVLAGDISVVGSRVHKNVFGPFIKKCSEQFLEVVIIAGNHEFYYSNFEDVLPKLRASVGVYDNITVLQNETVYIDDVAFIGATLWTDCGTLNDASTYSYHTWNGMTDSKIITYKGRKMSVDNCRQEFLTSRDYILKEIPKAKAAGYKTVVVIHHCPSNKSVHPMYQGPGSKDFNIFFKSDMDLDFAEANADIVVHGHTHHAFDYMLDEQLCNTRVICNPKGYAIHEGKPEDRGFNPQLRIEL